MKRLKELEGENWKAVSDLTLDKLILRKPTRHDPVQIVVGMLPLDRAVPPRVDPLVKIRRRRRRDLRASYASVISSTRRTETPARYISIKASSTDACAGDSA